MPLPEAFAFSLLYRRSKPSVHDKSLIVIEFGVPRTIGGGSFSNAWIRSN